jgi:hypothetical protein
MGRPFENRSEAEVPASPDEVWAAIALEAVKRIPAITKLGRMTEPAIRPGGRLPGRPAPSPGWPPAPAA